MIVVATSETTPQSRCPSIPSAVTSVDLENLTGADFAISPLGMPFTTKFLPRHIDAGMLLIQRKSGGDFCASISDGRLYASLARMRATGARQWQCVLMTTGRYEPAKNGKVRIITPTFHDDGRVTTKRRLHTHMHYASVQSAIEGWTWLGGVYLPLSCDAEIPSWCARTEKRLKDKSGTKTRELWPAPPELYDPPEKDDPLQKPVLIKDWRAVLAAFPGVGPVRVTALRDAMLEHGTHDTLLWALIWATDKGTRVRGWGKGTRRRVREMLGLEDGFQLSLELEERYR